MRNLPRSRRVHLWSGLLLACIATPAVALAAPFCLRTQALTPQCIYADPAQCERDASRQGGVCSVNTDAVTLNPGIGQYCMVTGSLVSLCVYPDRGTCLQDALRHNGACVEAPQLAPFKAPDPYAAVGGQ